MMRRTVWNLTFAEKQIMEEELEVPHEYWIERPSGVSFMAWLAINQARHLCALWGTDLFCQWVRQELPGHNFARWWQKYGEYFGVE
jgi:hypothetical protein